MKKIFALCLSALAANALGLGFAPDAALGKTGSASTAAKTAPAKRGVYQLIAQCESSIKQDDALITSQLSLNLVTSNLKPVGVELNHSWQTQTPSDFLHGHDELKSKASPAFGDSGEVALSIANAKGKYLRFADGATLVDRSTVNAIQLSHVRKEGDVFKGDVLYRIAEADDDIYFFENCEFKNLRLLKSFFPELDL